MTATDRVPTELDGYQRIHKLEKSFESVEKLREKIGCIFLLLVVAGIACCVYYRQLPAWITITVVALALSAVVALIWLSFRTAPSPSFSCPNCQREMTLLETPLQGDEPPQKDAFGAYPSPNKASVGADGYTYGITRDNSGPKNRLRYTVYKLSQSWCTCANCQVCFRAEARMYTHIKSFSKENEAQLLKDHLTGQHKQTSEFLRQLGGDDDPDGQTFLDRLSSESDPSQDGNNTSE